MRKLQAVLAVALMLVTATVAQAQQPQGQGGQRGGGRNMTAMLVEGITLSAAQQVQVDSLTKKYADQRQAMMSDESMDREARMGKMREMMTKLQDEIKALLTDEQKKVFEKNVADMATRRPSGGGGRPPLR